MNQHLKKYFEIPSNISFKEIKTDKRKWNISETQWPYNLVNELRRQQLSEKIHRHHLALRWNKSRRTSSTAAAWNRSPRTTGPLSTAPWSQTQGPAPEHQCDPTLAIEMRPWILKTPGTIRLWRHSENPLWKAWFLKCCQKYDPKLECSPDSFGGRHLGMVTPAWLSPSTDKQEQKVYVCMLNSYNQREKPGIGCWILAEMTPKRVIKAINGKQQQECWAYPQHGKMLGVASVGLRLPNLPKSLTLVIQFS